MKDIANPTQTRHIMDRFKLTTKKNFGQNFLIDPNIIRKIVGLTPLSKKSAVIEIGPGIGAMSEQIARQAGKLLAFEIDTNLKPVLSYTLGEYDNIEIIFEDFLKIDLNAYVNQLKQYYEEVYVIANLPYYITTPILMKIFESRADIKQIVAMMQKEVAIRLSAAPGGKEYNSLSITAQYFSHPRIAIPISKEVFTPKPNVDSAVVVFETKKQELQLLNEAYFFEVVKACFKQRRKTLLNNLKEYLQDRAKAEHYLSSMNIDLNVRADALDIHFYAKLANEMWRDQID